MEKCLSIAKAQTPSHLTHVAGMFSLWSLLTGLFTAELLQIFSVTSPLSTADSASILYPTFTVSSLQPVKASHMTVLSSVASSPPRFLFLSSSDAE